jgi:hypothetical protein
MFLTVIMMGLTLSTARNHNLDNLPLRDLLILVSACGSVIGAAVAWAGPTAWTRAWVGGLWMGYCALRALAFAWLIAARTSGPIEFIDQSSPIIAWIVGGFLGYLVWHRRLSDPYERQRP